MLISGGACTTSEPDPNQIGSGDTITTSDTAPHDTRQSQDSQYVLDGATDNNGNLDSGTPPADTTADGHLDSESPDAQGDPGAPTDVPGSDDDVMLTELPDDGSNGPETDPGSEDDIEDDLAAVEDAEADITPDALPEEDASPAMDVGPAEDVDEDKKLWILSIDNSTNTLQRIDVETAETTDLCKLSKTMTLLPLPVPVPIPIFGGSSYTSLTFSRDNILYASQGGSALDAIDPCTCEVTSIGSYGGWTGVNGITSDHGINLFGVAISQDETISIDTESGLAASVGALGIDFGYTGATWDEIELSLYAIDATSDGLYRINPGSGLATWVADLSMPFTTVGIEIHPDSGEIYACTDDAMLRRVDKSTGEVTEVGQINQTSSCNNLAAPWMPVPCIEP